MEVFWKVMQFVEDNFDEIVEDIKSEVRGRREI